MTMKMSSRQKIWRKKSSDDDFESDFHNSQNKEDKKLINKAKKLDFFSDNSGNEFIDRLNIKISKRKEGREVRKESDDEMDSSVSESDRECFRGSKRERSPTCLSGSDSERKRGTKKRSRGILESDDDSEGSNDKTEEEDRQSDIRNKLSRKIDVLKDEDSSDEDIIREKHRAPSVSKKTKISKSKSNKANVDATISSKRFQNSSDSESSDQPLRPKQALNKSKTEKNVSDSDDDVPLKLAGKNGKKDSGSITKHLKKSPFRKKESDSTDSDSTQPFKETELTVVVTQKPETSEDGETEEAEAKFTTIKSKTSSSDEESLAQVKMKRNQSKGNMLSEEEFKKEFKQVRRDRESVKKTTNRKTKFLATIATKKTKRNAQVSDSEDELPLAKTKKEIVQTPKARLSNDKSGENTVKASGISFTSKDEEFKIEKKKQLEVTRTSVTEDDDEMKNESKSSDSEDDRPLIEKQRKASIEDSDEDDKSVTTTSMKNGNERSESSVSESADEDRPLKENSSQRKSKNNLMKTNDEKIESDSIEKSDLSDSETERNVSAQRNAKDDEGSSTEEDTTPDPKKKASSRKDKADDRDGRIERLKRYIRTAGLRVQYSKVLEGCKSKKAKASRLLDILADAGLKGKPTLESCKKLRKKRERQREVAELDVGNIIASEGRSRRQARSSIPSRIPRTIGESPKPIKKAFSRLKGIVDSDDSE